MELSKNVKSKSCSSKPISLLGKSIDLELYQNMIKHMKKFVLDSIYDLTGGVQFDQCLWLRSWGRACGQGFQIFALLTEARPRWVRWRFHILVCINHHMCPLVTLIFNSYCSNTGLTKELFVWFYSKLSTLRC